LAEGISRDCKKGHQLLLELHVSRDGRNTYVETVKRQQLLLPPVRRSSIWAGMAGISTVCKEAEKWSAAALAF
jgi:hypothetical protein